MTQTNTPPKEAPRRPPFGPGPGRGGPMGMMMKGDKARGRKLVLMSAKLTRRDASLVVVMQNGNTIEAAAEQLGIGFRCVG